MGKILIVDDEKDICDSLAELLTKEGYKVKTALNGEEALKMIKAEKPDLVLLDVRIPRMDGVELLRHIKEIDKHIPAAMITAYKDLEKAEEALKIGAYDYITKPFDFDYLKMSILSKVFPNGPENNRGRKKGKKIG